MNTEIIDSIISITEKYMQKLKEEIETLQENKNENQNGICK